MWGEGPLFYYFGDGLNTFSFALDTPVFPMVPYFLSPVEGAQETGRPSRGVSYRLSGQRKSTIAEGLDADPRRRA